MGSNIDTMIYMLPAVLIGLTLHEFSHAYVAMLLGDTTAKNDGRITLNPLKHIDPLGMIVLLIAGFGWAKPVKFDPTNLKHPKRDRMLISVAGPLTNLILGVIFLLLIKLMILKGMFHSSSGALFRMLFYIATINLSLFIFNMIPIPPLDGSHILFSSINLSDDLERQIYRYGSFALLFIIIIQNNTGLDIIPIGKFVHFVIRLIFPNSQ